jgi:glycerol-3-phosphate dehydrogenase (NAD(P)+)
MSSKGIAVVGGGAWGTALAQLFAAEDSPVQLWAREADVVTSINEAHENRLFLPGVALSPALRATGDLSELADADLLFIVVPVPFLRSVLAQLPRGRATLILCSKGMEAGTFAFPVDIARALHPDAPIAVLSGPTFAAEVARGLPTAVTLAADPPGAADAIARRIARPCLRPYASDDVIGAEVGGAVKNVLAIACGVVAGAELGENARAALISRGFAEMARFGVARGARMETLAGLAGLGDLVLTCSSSASRNFSLGKGLGEGRAITELMADRRTIAEGAFSAPVLNAAARAMGVDMPIVAAVDTLVAGNADPRAVIDALLARPLRGEGL